MRYASLAFVFVNNSVKIGCKNKKFFRFSQIYFPMSGKVRIFAVRNNMFFVMTAVDIRAAINNDLNTFPPDLLQVVADFVRSLRMKNEGADTTITPLLACMFTGHSVNVSDAELDAAREDYLKEKYL